MKKKYNVDIVADHMIKFGLVPTDTTTDDDVIVKAAPAADDNRGPDPDDIVILADGTRTRRRWL